MHESPDLRGYPRDESVGAADVALGYPTVVRMDKRLRPLVPRMTRLVESYAEFLRWQLRERSLEALFTAVRDLRALAQLFDMAAVVELCGRIERAALERMDDEASRCIDQLASVVHEATFIYS